MGLRTLRRIASPTCSFTRLTVLVVGMLWVSADVCSRGAEGVTAPATSGRFQARITGSDVHIRSGAGTNFYRCGKLQQGDRVTVVEQAGGWSKIVPPVGSFSWIAMQYVALSTTDPTQAVVTGANVAVYAGSDFVEPMHSTSKQVTLTRGTRVKLLNEMKDSYFKIVPPTGCYLWVSSLYVEPITEPAVPPVTPLRIVTESAGPEPNTASPPATPAVTPSMPEPQESVQLKAYYALQQRVKDELDKPLMEQDYTVILAALKGLVEDKAAGDVSRYAAHLIARIEGYQLAQRAGKMLEQQDRDLAATRQRLLQAKEQGKAEVSKTGRFAVMGVFKASHIYRAQVRRYPILDARGKIICYAEPVGALADQDFQGYVGKRVGLVGKIRPFPAVGGALVVFTKIVPLDDTP